MMDPGFWRIMECAFVLPIVVFGVIVFKKDRLVSMLLISAAVLNIAMVLNYLNIAYWLSSLKLPFLARAIVFRFFSIARLVPWMLVLLAVFVRRSPRGPLR
jgi:hypothetical protein